MIRPTAKTPNTTDTIVSVISHLGRFYPSTAAFHFVSGRAEPRIESRGSPNANDYSPMCKPLVPNKSLCSESVTVSGRMHLPVCRCIQLIDGIRACDLSGGEDICYNRTALKPRRYEWPPQRYPKSQKRLRLLP